MIGKLTELEKSFNGHPPNDKWLRTRVRLLQALSQAQGDHRLGYEFRGMSNKQLMTRIELFRRMVADGLDVWTNWEIDDALTALQGERRRRKRNAKVAQAEATSPSAQEEEKIQDDELVEEYEEVEHEDLVDF
jgi:hypothetical protein